uniref:Uncharacterized protein n=1 Tax=Arundo donax TaxID=35708 RepID=A0A0A9G9B7_ARUDO
MTMKSQRLQSQDWNNITKQSYQKEKISIYIRRSRATWTMHSLFTYKNKNTVRKQARPIRDTYLFLDRKILPLHRPSAEVNDSANPAGRAGMLPLLSSRLRTLPSAMLPSASCQLFTIWSSGRCRSMPR